MAEQVRARVDRDVYERLDERRREDERTSDVIARLLEEGR